MFQSIFEETMVTSNWQEIQKAGEQKLPVLFPIGVIEEHGPHLPLGCDIYWSYMMCRMVKEKLRSEGRDCVIAPPYYWGINFCTGAFPGSFSLKPETMQQVLGELLDNLKGFGFTEIYCFSYHGDPVHVKTLAETIQKWNLQSGARASLFLEKMDVRIYGFSGKEDYLLVTDPKYPPEWFAEVPEAEAHLYDIHAGAFETAVIQHFCPEQVDVEKACSLPSSSLDRERMKQWSLGGEATRKVVPLGYAGNPAGYGVVENHVKEMLELQVAAIAEKIR